MIHTFVFCRALADLSDSSVPLPRPRLSGKSEESAALLKLAKAWFAPLRAVS